MNKLEKFFNLVKKHLLLSLAIVLGTTAVLMTGISFLTSYLNYAKYSEDYEKTKKELLANTPQLPEETFKDNDYVTYDDAAKTVTGSKSKYQASYVYDIHDAEIDLDKGEPVYETVEGTSWEIASGFKTGGSVTYTIETSENGDSDIDIVLAIGEVKTQVIKKNNRETTGPMNIKNITDYTKITLNGLQISTMNFDIPADDTYHHLVLKDTHLITGVNTLKFETWLSVNDNFIMPAIRTVTFLTDAPVVNK